MRFLVVRRDNIGDLVCTTPLFAALRRRHPDAWIGALVNSYNAPVLEGNPDLSEVITYTKLKHVDAGHSRIAALGARLAEFARLRRMRIDCAILATTHFVPRAARLARWLAPREVVGFSDGSTGAARSLHRSVMTETVEGLHEVERVFTLARLLGIDGAPPPLKVVPREEEVRRARQALPAGAKTVVAVHVSARRPLQRWPAERYAALIGRLAAEHGAATVLLWSPGAAADPRHPGDDDKAASIVEGIRGHAAVVPYRTERLEQLIGALAACDAVICSDGGHAHIAAALGKPMVALFGDASPQRWRPWGVPHRVVQPPSRTLADASVDDVLRAYADLIVNV